MYGYLMLVAFFLSMALAIVSFFMGKRARIFSLASAWLMIALVGVYSYLTFGGGYSGGFVSEYTFPIASSIGISFSTGLSGFTDGLVILSSVIILIALMVVDREAGSSVYGLILSTEVGLFGLLISRNFLFFYIFWEVVLVPMYFLIIRFGSKNRDRVGLKFFVYTHIGSVFILLAFFTLYNYYYLDTGSFTLNIGTLMNTSFINTKIPAFWKDFLLFGFLIGFLVKLPSFPVHSWLPDTYDSAPYPGTIILAGGLSLMGGYGLFGILLPASGIFGSTLLYFLVFLGILSLVYFSFVAMFQKDVKRMMAFASAAAMGFVTISFSAGILENSYPRILELSGGMFQIIAHGFIMALIFASLYYIRRNTGTEKTFGLGGIYREAPLLSSFMLAGLFASLGLPGLAGFIGEFSIVAGVFQGISWWIFFIILGMIVTASYHVWVAQKALFGPYNENLGHISDVSKREFAMLCGLLVLIFVLGIFPNLLDGLLTAYVGGLI